MKRFSFGQEYYLTNYNELNEYLKFMINDDSNKQIKYIFTNDSLNWRETENGKEYSIFPELFIVFDNDAVVRINYNFYSSMYVRYMWIQNLNIQEKEFDNDNFKLDLDVKDTRIEDFEIERFSEEYEINPSSGTVRPDGGDYFKKITFNLSNGKKLCICAEDSETDGYCDIWTE